MKVLKFGGSSLATPECIERVAGIVSDECGRTPRLAVVVSAIAARFDRRFEELKDLLHGVLLVHECSPRTQDQILSCGKRLSADLVAAALRRVGPNAC